MRIGELADDAARLDPSDNIATTGTITDVSAEYSGAFAATNAAGPENMRPGPFSTTST